GYAIEAGGVDQDVEFVFLPGGFYALRGDALDRLIDEGIDQRHVVAVVSFEITAFQRHPARAEAVILGDQLVRHFRIRHALANLFGDVGTDGGVGFLVGQDIAEVAHPDAKAGLTVTLLPERFALLGRHVQGLAGVSLMNEPARRRRAGRINFLITGSDLLHLLFAYLR